MVPDERDLQARAEQVVTPDAERMYCLLQLSSQYLLTSQYLLNLLRCMKDV